jgi:hypothetical protein
MQKGIENLLKRSPGLLAKEMARELGVEKTALNSFLHSKSSEYFKDDEFCWYLKRDVDFLITTTKAAWIGSTHVESALRKQGSPLESKVKYLNIIIEKERNLLLDAIAKILAIANQAVQMGKIVSIDIAAPDTLSYLHRARFFDRLHPDVKVTPKRPTSSAEDKIIGSNHRIVELQEIGVPKANVPKQIRNSLEQNASDQKGNVNAVQFAISELVNNVEDHSQTPYPGFAGLQCYGGSRPNVMLVVSDNGLGICGTLRPVLASKYPDLALEFPAGNPESDPHLIIKAFTQGGISQVIDDDSRGTGLHTSGRQAANLNANVLIRQENFEIHLKYRDGNLGEPQLKLGLPKLLGTHVVFSFFLTKYENSA